MRRRALTRAAAIAILCAGVAGTAAAQTAAPDRGSIELAAGAVYVGGYDLGPSTAELTRNSGAPFDLFETESRVDRAAGFQGRIGYYLTRNLVLEGGFRYAQPVLEVNLSGDAEDAADVTAEETLSHYVVDGAVVWHLDGMRFAGGRGVPFLTAGAGYLRELHQRDELVETGQTYHAGGGIKYWFARRAGIRAEAGVSVRDGGFDFEDGARSVPIAAASVLIVF